MYSPVVPEDFSNWDREYKLYENNVLHYDLALWRPDESKMVLGSHIRNAAFPISRDIIAMLFPRISEIGIVNRI